MDEEEICPILKSVKNLKLEFHHLKHIPINSNNFTLGRSLQNSIVIPFLAISRTHCTFKKDDNNIWSIVDSSSCGIKVNGVKIGKNISKILTNEDIITMEPFEEFVYKFSFDNNENAEIPRKRIKLDGVNVNEVKKKFEESQNCELKHIEERIQNAKKIQTTSILLKKQLHSEMNRKINHLESDFATQIENLKGKKNEIEQKAQLIEERDTQLANVKHEMEGKIAKLMLQIEKHNESESELLNENNLLKEKLLKEREEFLAELSRESSSKQEMLNQLEMKMREQEQIRQKEKQELQEMLKHETEQLKLGKEREFKVLEEQNQVRETELQQELNNIRLELQQQVEQTEKQKHAAEEILNKHLQQMKKLGEEEKVKMEHLVNEREEIKKKLSEAEMKAEISLEELRKRVTEREIELAAIASENIEKQAKQSSEVISTLQLQLEKIKNELHTVETEKKTLLKTMENSNPLAEVSKQNTLTEVGELIESELQCSICAELFVEATTLNCSHTFCKYCISMWMKKKRDCPICRSSITSECRSLVLDTFIDKMVQSLTEEMKTKRELMLKQRAAEASVVKEQKKVRGRRRGRVSRTYRVEVPPVNWTQFMVTLPVRPPIVPQLSDDILYSLSPIDLVSPDDTETEE